VKSRLEDWKAAYPRNYQNAYVPESAPALFAPFVRLQLLRCVLPACLPACMFACMSTCVVSSSLLVVIVCLQGLAQVRAQRWTALYARVG
jgi:hypothetical protein